MQLKNHKQTMKQLFQFKEVPADWALCFRDECPVHEQCQRWLAGSYAPKTLAIHPCVTPMTVKKERPCKYYVKPEPVTLAYGFGDLFSQVRRNEYEPLRRAVYRIFGSESSYYRCKRGKRPISPEQQESVKKLFREHGYEHLVTFLRTQETYNFPPATP